MNEQMKSRFKQRVKIGHTVWKMKVDVIVNGQTIPEAHLIPDTQ